MDAEKIGKIRDAVRRNFEASPVQYDDFESRHGFFRNLNAILLETMDRENPRNILDVGCGTGASSIQLLQACPQARVCGLDNSPAMLEKARMKCCSNDRIDFIEGDASALGSCLRGRFDTIIYSASIFLIPDFRESLRQACSLLEPGGKIGITFMDGVYGETGNNLLVEADQQLGLGVSLKKPVSLPDLEAFIKSILGSIKVVEHNFDLPRDVVKDFFSIPAMSAGLFPAFDYQERLNRVSALFANMSTDNVIFRWVVIIGSKP